MPTDAAQIYIPPINTFDSSARVSIPIPVQLLLWYLAAITIFGKGPAYLLFPPFFLGEMLMVLLSLWVSVRCLATGFPARIITPLFIIIIIFMLLGAVHMLHDYGKFGVLAIRDSSVWYYAIFYLIGVYISTLPNVALWFWKKLIWVWIAAMVWWLVNLHTDGFFINLGPDIPWRKVALLSGSGSENIQHMSCAVILLFLGLPRKAKHTWQYILILAISIIAISALYGVYSRGVKIAVIAAWFVGWLATQNARTPLWPSGRQYVVAYSIVIIIGIYAISKGPGGLYRAGGLQRFESASTVSKKGTAFWRLEWWRNIYAEVSKLDPVNGLGFGISLDQFNPSLKGRKWAFPVRSPHNINMTIFARMGWLGTFVWALILILGIGGLFLASLRGGARGKHYTLDRHKEITFWLIFLSMTVINSSFGVLMEGPVLGIWFWFALGFGMGRSVDPSGFDL